VVIGGVHATLLPDEAAGHADAIVTSYAEKSWPQLLHDFAAGRRQLRELGIVQWDREVTDMFNLPTSSQLAQAAYKIYAGQITAAWRKGLAGEKTTPADVGGNCAATFNAQ